MKWNEFGGMNTIMDSDLGFYSRYVIKKLLPPSILIHTCKSSKRHEIRIGREENQNMHLLEWL